METRPYSYAESGSSSPRSRDSNLDSTNPAVAVTVTVPPSSSSWEEHPHPHPHPQPRVPPHHKVKFFVSYGGQIQPRHHDIHLSYVGGHTKILYVDRSISFSSLISKLSSLIDHSTSLPSFKYQLPGEDLDALISVSNDDDLQHLMHEYDRLYRASPKPVRFRLFLFPPDDHSSRFGSGSGDNHLDRYTEALNSAPAATENISNKVDFLFGLGSQDPMIQELNKLQISGRPRNDARESHLQKPMSYRPVAVERPQQQPVYVYQAPQQASVYHAPQLPTQRYYQVPSAPVYYQDTTGTQVYYAAPGGVGLTTPFQGVPPVVVSAGFTTAGVDGRVWRKKQKVMIYPPAYEYN